MGKSTDSENLAALEEVAPCSVGMCSDTPTIIVRHGSAGNYATCEDPAVSRDHAEQWGRRAFSPHAFGDVATTDTASSARPTSYEMYHAARVHRSLILGRIIPAAIQAVRAIARRALARHRQRRQATLIHDALHQLDDHALRDLGFDRSEIRSVAAEVTGVAERTRLRVITLDETPDRRYRTAYDHFMVKREACTLRRV